MRFLAFFAISSLMTATIAGGSTAFMLGNLGALAGAGRAHARYAEPPKSELMTQALVQR